MKQDEKSFSSKTQHTVSVNELYEEAKRKNIMDWGEIDTAESVLKKSNESPE